MFSRRLLIIIFLLFSCATRVTQTTGEMHAPSGSDSTDSALRLELVQKAEQAMADDMRLDYRRPMLDAPYDRTGVQNAYFEACTRGDDKQSCWIAASLPGPKQAVAQRMIIINCRAGHLQSCRAVTTPAKALPGGEGRDDSCGLFHQCDMNRLRQECDAGFPRSCSQLMADQPDPIDTAALEERIAKLESEGCRLGIYEDCLGHESEESMRRYCMFKPIHCVRLSEFYAERENYLGERDALERACQYTTTGEECHTLGLAYFRRRLVEPVQGRGRTLIEWYCKQVASRGHDPALCLAVLEF